jgi:hypothetical protein
MSTPSRNDLTNTVQIVVDWSAITAPNDGNSPVLSYSLEFDAGTSGQVWEVLTGYLADSTDTSALVTT